MEFPDGMSGGGSGAEYRPPVDRQLVGPRLGSQGRHGHALIPAEHACGAREVGDLREPPPELDGRRRHVFHPTRAPLADPPIGSCEWTC